MAEELPRFYEGLYVDDSEEHVKARNLGYSEKHIRKIIRRLRPEGGRLLDLGCGFGKFLKIMEDQPWELTGVEISETAASYTRNLVPKTTVHEGMLTEVDLPPASQDCIVMLGVLEHLKDPRTSLKHISKWLTPGGILIVQVPYMASYIRLKHWFPFIPIAFEAPRHLFDFSPTTLTRYFHLAGYEDVSVDIARPYACPSWFGLALICCVKFASIALYSLSFRHFVFPYCGAIVVSGIKKETIVNGR